jgi:acyl-CoA reductase-like NAD-dependent aldehyde dehydrogenase
MSVSVKVWRNYVGGEWVEPLGDGTIDVLNPATGEIIAATPAGTEKDIDRAVQAADRAFAKWSETTPGQRQKLLLKIADTIDQNRDELGGIESQNVGKPFRYATGEMVTCADNLRFFAGAARTLEGRPMGEYARGMSSMTRREPIGVIGSIAPWNYPLMMAIWKFGPALATGNTVV